MITYNDKILKINSKWLRGIDFNPLKLPPLTIRVRYTWNIDHSGDHSWTFVRSYDGNYIWDLHLSRTSYSYPIGALDGVTEIVAANIKDIEYLGGGLVNQNPYLVKCCSLDLSNAIIMPSLFSYCTYLTEPPEYIKVSSALNIGGMFAGCYRLEKGTTKFIDGDKVLVANSLYEGCLDLTEVSDITLPNVTATANMFSGCPRLTHIDHLDVKPIYAKKMFFECSSLEHIPNFDTSETVNMDAMCSYCSGIAEVPLIDTQSVTSVTESFYMCKSVSGGALDLYNQMSTQTNPPSRHNLTFYDCGANTTTGAAELAQIPSDWKTYN